MKMSAVLQGKLVMEIEIVVRNEKISFTTYAQPLKQFVEKSIIRYNQTSSFLSNIDFCSDSENGGYNSA